MASLGTRSTGRRALRTAESRLAMVGLSSEPAARGDEGGDDGPGILP